MTRISEKHLESVCNTINRMTGSPEQPYLRTEEGKYLPQAHCFHLEYSNGGVRLARMCSTGTATSTELPGGTKRALYEQMHAMIQGLRIAKVS